MMRVCEYCSMSVPEIDLIDTDLKHVVAVLESGSRTLAVGEVKLRADCLETDAKLWVDHLIACKDSLPLSEADNEILAIIDEAFADIEKPEHFTNYTHCDECEEHDNTLRSRTRINITRQDLGNPGWDPITFTNAQGIAYYFPALVRFSLVPSLDNGCGWYGEQLIYHLSYISHNQFLAYCNKQQREAVVMLLKHLGSGRGQWVLVHLSELEKAINLWSQDLPTLIKSYCNDKKRIRS